MITAVHTLIYSEDPPATRAFFRDVLGWPYREDAESEPDWLIFASGPSELGVHPNSWTYGGQTTTVPIHHEVSLMCDDVAATVADLRTKGVAVEGQPGDLGFGIGLSIPVPGAGQMLLYQPRYQPSYDL
jgi:catechol 2,3-dioxygenase-like lactoylglutathione lyase family enzyme